MKSNLIIISGAPGSGKTTISELLQKKFDSPLIDFGNLRIFHLDRKWKKANKKEEVMSFENLVFILKNYIKHGYKNVIVNDLNDDKIFKLARVFRKNLVIFSLILNDKELEKRVVNSERDSGFRNITKALKYNQNLRKRKQLKNEFRIENSHNNPKKTLNEILRILEK